jgi:hypothetical protein
MDQRPWCWQWLIWLRNFSLYTECEVSWPRLHIPLFLYILSQSNPFQITHYPCIHASVSQVIRVNSVRISRLYLSCCMCQPSHTTCYITVVVGVIQGGVPTVSSSIFRFLHSDVCCFNPILSLYKPHENGRCSVKFLVLFVVSVIYLQNVHRPVSTLRRGWVALLHSGRRPHVVEFQ